MPVNQNSYLNLNFTYHLGSSSMLGGSSLSTNRVRNRTKNRLAKWLKSVFALAWTTKMSNGWIVWAATAAVPTPLRPNGAMPWDVRTLVARSPRITNAPKRVTNMPRRLMVVPTLTARRVRFAADIREVPSRRRRRDNLAPPHVQKMDMTDKVMPNGFNKQRGDTIIIEWLRQGKALKKPTSTTQLYPEHG